MIFNLLGLMVAIYFGTDAIQRGQYFWAGVHSFFVALNLMAIVQRLG